MKARTYLGVVIEPVGIAYRIWPDFVTADYCQPRLDTLSAAKAAIKAVRS